MNAFSGADRARRRTAAAAACLVIAAAPGGVNAADVGDPVELAPDDGPSVSAPATGDSPASGGNGAASGETSRGDGGTSGSGRTAGSGDDGPSGIRVDTLGELDPASIGVLDPSGDGLGAAIWDGTPRHLVSGLIPRLPARLESPALRELARRLLLSRTAPPDRTRSTGGDGPNILHARVRRLWEMGSLDGVTRLLSVVPRRHESAALRRLRVKTLFLQHARKEACGHVRDAVDTARHVFWQKALAVCQQAAGKPSQADLTVELLRSQGADGVQPFIRVYDAITGGGDLNKAAGPAPDALTLALLAATETPVPKGILKDAAPAVLAAVAQAPGTPLARRAVAAERAAALGALPPEALAGIYAAFDFPSERLANGASLTQEDAVQAMTPLRRRALYVQALARKPKPAVQADLVHQTMRDAPAALRPVIARLTAPAVARMDPAPARAWFAGPAVRVLYLAGKPDAARPWLTMAQNEAVLDPQAKAAVTALIPYARLMGAGPVPANGGLGTWRSAANAEGTTLTYRESLVRAAFAALSIDDARRWVDIAASGTGGARPVPPAAEIYALRTAARDGRVGETVLLSLMVLGRDGLVDVHPVTLATALKALDQVGLTAAARRIAVEAAAVNGI